MNIARRGFRSALLACTLGVLTGCTALVSEKPVFAPTDYDTTGALLGHYQEYGGQKQVVVTRGADGELVFLGFESKPVPKKKDSKAQDQAIWAQALYAEAAAIPLGGGDYVLQVSCTALAHDGKTFAGWLGGKVSPFKNHTAYAFLAEDRKKDYLWFSANFYASGDDNARVFNRYGVQKPPGKDDDVRIIPADISRSATMAMFRELIALDMASSGSPELYHRENRDGQPDENEAAAMVIKDSAQCHRLQTEGDPPKDGK